MKSHAPPLDRPGDDRAASTAHFTLHSHPWVNLHQLLSQWARQEAARSARSWPSSADVSERGHVDALSPQHQHTWRATLDVYQRQVTIRDLVSDPVLKALRHRVTRIDSVEAEASPVLVSDIMGALRAVMPIYCPHCWGAHDGANRRWIAQVLF
jgi:hypothetical protein